MVIIALIIFFILYIVPMIYLFKFIQKVLGMIEDVKEINHNLFEIAKFLEESRNERANQIIK